MMRYVTASEMRALESAAIRYGISAETLMERAGAAVADAGAALAPAGSVLVVCGYGNNGGDGFVAARHLAKKNYRVVVVLIGKPNSLSPAANANLEKLFTLGVNPLPLGSKDDITRFFDGATRPAFIVDTLFGIGARGSLEEPYIEAIGRMNSLGAPIVSADIPSGLDADTGTPLGAAVKATATVTMAFRKAGFKNPAAAEYLGTVSVADIGIVDAPAASQGVAGPALPKGRVGPQKTVVVRDGKKGRRTPGHPWIYRGQLRALEGIKGGDIVTVNAANGKLIGRGYYNQQSDIAIRLLTFADEEIDAALIERKVRAAFERRAPLMATTNAYRAVYSEADGLPGLIVDVYADTAVVQILTLGMERLKESVIAAVNGVITPRAIYEKSESPYRNIEGLKDTKGWIGAAGKSQIEIFEGRVKFLVDIERGHKTGFYLDQRKSRLALEPFCKGKRVLDLFCYTGGFSVSAAVFGAAAVTGIDVKREWCDLAAKNAALNGVADKSSFRSADAFDAVRELYSAGERFDLVIVDPPSFARDRRSLTDAARGYKDINLIAMKLLTERGVLATFSCSHNVPNELFADILKRAAANAKKKLTILKRCHQAEDHPIARAIPETEYLKGYFFTVTTIA